MKRKINTVYFKNGLMGLDINIENGNLEVLDVVKKINNMQLQCNDVKDIIETLIISEKGQICLNFNDVKSMLAVEGGAFVAICHESGESPTTKALLEIIEAFNKHRVLNEDTKVLLNFVGNRDIGVFELDHALRSAKEFTSIEPDVYLGLTLEESLVGEVYIVAIVTGL